MAAMSNNNPNETNSLLMKLGQFLADSKARDVLVLDVAPSCSWASTFVIATYNSQGHLKGLVQELDGWAAENLPQAPRHMKKNQVNEWMLVDWDDIVIHLFSESARAYYELEGLWFSSPVIYRQASAQ